MPLISKDVLAWPAEERAAYYQSEAEKHRQMAETEDAEKVRAQLLAMADQYQALADSLSSRPAGIADQSSTAGSGLKYGV